MICCWWKSKEPKEVEIKINIFYLFTAFVPEIIWYGFGSFFAFSESMYECRSSDELEARILWITSLVLIIHSYIYFILLLFIFVGFCIAYRIWSRWAADEENMSTKSPDTNIPAELLAEIPIINNLDTFALHRFHATTT